MWKNGLIRNIRLISKFMKSQPGSQTIAIHILPNTITKERQPGNEVWSGNRV